MSERPRFRAVAGLVGHSTTVRIGTARLTRLRGVPREVVREFTMDGRKPLLFVEIQNAGEPAQLMIYPDPGTGLTADERWLRIKHIVAKREGVPLPCIEFVCDP